MDFCLSCFLGKGVRWRERRLSMAHVATEVQTDACSPWCCLKPCWGLWAGLLSGSMLVFSVCAAAEAYDGVSSPCCSKGPCWCPWLVLPLETMLRAMTCADARDHVNVRGPCCPRKPCGSLWSKLPLTVKGKKTTFAVLSMTIDSVEQERHRRLFNIPINKRPPVPTERYSTAHLGICSNKLEEDHHRPKVWKTTLKHWSHWWCWKVH